MGNDDVDPMDTTDDTVERNEVTTIATAASTKIPIGVSDLPGSEERLKDIIYKFQQQIQRIDELEHRIDDRVTRSRRRISSLLEHQAPITRPSHLRLFVSHSYTKPKPSVPPPPTPLQPVVVAPTSLTPVPNADGTVTSGTGTPTPTTLPTPPPPPIPKRVLPNPAVWTLNLEGVLLIDHLDYDSAVQYDRQTGYVPPTDDLDRSRGETKEEDKGDFISKILFSKYFEMIKVTFQTTFYHPEKAAQAAAAAAAAAVASANPSTVGLSPKKRSPKKKTTKRSAALAENQKQEVVTTGNWSSGGDMLIDPKSLYVSSKQILVWTKDMFPSIDQSDNTKNDTTTNHEEDNTSISTSATGIKKSTSFNPTVSQQQGSNNNTYISVTSSHDYNLSDIGANDAHIVCLQYEEPQPPPLSAAGSGGLTVYSVIANIELYRRKNYAAPDTTIDKNNSIVDEYRVVNTKLAQLLFPQYGPERTDILSGAKKRKIYPNNSSKEGNPTINATVSISPILGDTDEPPADTNEIYVPVTLTMKEIVMAFFTYVRDRKLFDKEDKSVIVADEPLQDLLLMEHFPLSHLQKLLIENRLVEKVTDYLPIHITYVMKKDTACELGVPLPNDDDQPEGSAEPSLLQFDIDCAVPSLFPYRARELLRRIKRRELEYTSSRTKARYLLQPAIRSGGGSGAERSMLTAGATSSASATNREEEGEIIRSKVEQIVSQQSLNEDLIPVYLALAKAAPSGTEARAAAHFDARIAYVLARIQEHYAAAKESHEVLKWIQQSGQIK